MREERFSEAQIGAVKEAIYPFVEAYQLSMNPEDVELLAVAVLGATPNLSLDEVRTRSETLIAEHLESMRRMHEAMGEGNRTEPKHGGS